MTEAALQVPVTRGWLTRLVRLPNIFVDPAEIFDQEASDPNALIPLLVLAIGLGSLLMAYSGFMVNIALSSIPAAERSELAPSLAEMVGRNKWIGLALAPLYVGASALAVGMLISVVASVSAPLQSENGTLHRAVSIAAYASLVILFEQLLTYATVRVIGVEHVNYFWDLKPLPGLHYLVEDPDKHRVAFAVLERINFFTLGYGFVLAYGIRRVFRTSRMVASITALGAVLGEICVIAILAALKP
jgi:hypothetical protein